MPRVLIAVDGSELDRHTASVARELFGADADYLAINVAEPPSIAAPSVPVPFGVVFPAPYWTAADVAAADTAAGDTVVGDPVERSREVADRAGSEVGLDDVEALGEIGDPAQAIVAAAERHAVDVVVVGSRERSWFSRLVSPSVSGAVTSQSQVPVLVVREP